MHEPDFMELEGQCPECGQRFRNRYSYFGDVAPKMVIAERLLEGGIALVEKHPLIEHGKTMTPQITTAPIPKEPVWRVWTESNYYDYASTVDYTTTTSSTAWTTWTSSSSSTSATTSTVWVTWVDSGSGQGYSRDYQERVIGNFPPQPVETPQQIAARQEREREELARQARIERERQEKNDLISAKARELLRDVLTEGQNKELDEKGHFDIVTVSGNRYRIKKGHSYNVEKLDAAGKFVEKLCFAPPEVHMYDSMVTQKLMLECDEEGARRIANISRN
jgi:hypothetical protein